MNKNELDEILHDHRLWLKTTGRKGKRADLRRADLKRANFRNTDLRRADLEGADLRNADLREADLSFTNLKGAWLDEDWKGVPLVLGNVLVTECIKPGYFWRIKTWSVIKESNQEFYEVLYL